MLKENQCQAGEQELQQDLQFMLSSIRARQNTFVFYLQRYKNLTQPITTEFKLAKNQFQQKDKIYSRQINSILQKHTQFSSGTLYPVKAFWIKLKTIIKVSIERISSLEFFLAQKLLECYDKALIVVTRNLDSEKGLLGYRQVENAFKKRSIQALLLGKQTVSPTSVSYSESKIQKNRSQTLFKPQAAISRFTIEGQESLLFRKGENITVGKKQRFLNNYFFDELGHIKEENIQPKIKSLNRIKNRRPEQNIKSNMINVIKAQQMRKIKSASKVSEKHIKKINKHIQRYERNFQGAFDGKYEVSSLLDKKKTIFQNIYLLYDDLFAKNIPNHKMISKFMFNTTKINQILYNAYEKKKKAQQKKEKTMLDGKQKQASNPQKKYKQKEKDKEKQTFEQKQRNYSYKQTRTHRKIYIAKDSSHHPQIINNTKDKEPARQKKESQITAITSKNYTNHKQSYHEKQEKIQKVDKEKQKQKRIHRYKTAKTKLNPDSHPSHLEALDHNLMVGKHFVAQNQSQKISKKGAQTEKIVRTIGL